MKEIQNKSNANRRPDPVKRLIQRCKKLAQGPITTGETGNESARIIEAIRDIIVNSIWCMAAQSALDQADMVLKNPDLPADAYNDLNETAEQLWEAMVNRGC